MIELIPLFIAVFLSEVFPGPNTIAVAASSLGSGRRGGLATAMGIATGVFIWAIAFTFGIAALFQIYPQAVTFMKLIGGAYLVFMAINAVRSLIVGAKEEIKAGGKSVSIFAAYKLGLYVVLTNPKTVLMWVAISTYLAATGTSSLQFLIIGFCIALLAVVIYGTYAILFSTGFAMRAHKRFFRIIEGVFGAVFGLFGAKLLIDGFKELRT